MPKMEWLSTTANRDNSWRRKARPQKRLDLGEEQCSGSQDTVEEVGNPPFPPLNGENFDLSADARNY